VLTTITAGILGATLAVFITRHCTKTGEPFQEMKSTFLYMSGFSASTAFNI